ncbi:MAG: histidine kinase [Cytophagales bacterium]|nr:MAG: histidine kinase [Cytophagales bacterium]
MWESVHAFNRYLNQKLPFETGVLRRFFVQAGSCLAVMLIIHTSLIIRFETYYTDYFPSEIAKAIKVASYFLDVFMVVGVNTAYFGFYFFEKWKKNLVEKETWAKEKAMLQQERINAQYENLINQLNPHFLFNSLSSLDSLIDDNPSLARQFLGQLAKVYRYVLQHKDKELVSLETELTFVKNYVSLLETRFGGTFQLYCTIDSDALERQIVPVTLQILIENAIKHNSISEVTPLRVSLTSRDGYLEVSNPVQRKTQIATSNGQGLQNLRQLYSFLSSKEVVIESGEVFTVRVPLL